MRNLRDAAMSSSSVSMPGPMLHTPVAEPGNTTRHSVPPFRRPKKSALGLVALLAVAASANRPTSAIAATPIQPPLVGATSGSWLDETLPGIDQNTFHYEVLLPYNYSPNYTYPVIMYLHGIYSEVPFNVPPGGQFMSDINNTNNTNNGLPGINYRANWPAIVIAPQCMGSSFGSNDWGGTVLNATTQGETTLPATSKDMPCGDRAMQALSAVMSTYSVDPTKLYLTGYSLGGFGVWYLMPRNPGVFAAAIAVSGSEFSLGWYNPNNWLISGVDPTADAIYEQVLATTPMWVFHGVNDSTVSKYWDELAYTNSQNSGGTMKYTEFVVNGETSPYPYWVEPTDGHSCADCYAFESTTTMNWLFSQQTSSQGGGGGTPFTSRMIASYVFLPAPTPLLCQDINGGELATVGEPVEQWSCDQQSGTPTAPNQLFQFTPVPGATTYTISPTSGSNLCLDDVNNVVVQNTCSGAASQQWIVHHRLGTHYAIRTGDDLSCIQLPSLTPSYGGPIIVGPCVNNARVFTLGE